MNTVGIILLDRSEIITRMYRIGSTREIKLLHKNNHKLKNSKQNPNPNHDDIIEAIADTFFIGSAFSVSDWKICSRDFPSNTIKDITNATNTKIENLIKPRIQELICKGLITEF